MWNAIAAAINQIDADFRIAGREPVGGGCVNETWRLRGAERDYFVKLNGSALTDMFAAEAAALSELAATATVRVPRPMAHGTAAGRAFLVLEYIPLRSGGGSADGLLGQQMADLHRLRQPYFGWSRDNTIGATLQPNGSADDWIGFWRDKRLGFQLRLAAQHGGGNRLRDLGERLQECLPQFFAGYRPQPSLLHGDLWGGNYAADDQGRPVVFDPASYYGDREADLAMTELFGGFGPAFYAAYQEAWPLDPGYGTRKNLYNLYHILNHFNLFGGGYGRQAESMTERLLAETA